MDSSQQEQVTVIGLGYVGLPTAVFLASTDIKVHGVDLDPNKVNQINNATVPFVEPGFDQLLRQVIREGKLVATESTPPSENFIIAVPTPITTENTIDSTYVFDAARSIAPQLRGNELIILESTSTPGLTESIGEFIVRERPDLSLEPSLENSIYLVHAPERVLPGKIMDEMTTNSRIIGGLNPEAARRAELLYSRITKGKIFTTESRTAELTKLTENAFRDVNIAFANELSLICDELEIDVWELISLANQHPRVNVLQPGPGVGGHCIAVDPWFIVQSSPSNANLISMARTVNDRKPDFVTQKARRQINAQLNHGIKPQVAVLGITFKPDIDDLRESPSLRILGKLAEDYPDIKFLVTEPNIQSLPPELNVFMNIELVSLELALAHATITLLLVDHKEFKLNKDKILATHPLIDTRGISRIAN